MLTWLLPEWVSPFPLTSQPNFNYLTVVSTGVVPATTFLKDSGVPMTSRGEVVVDKVCKKKIIRKVGLDWSLTPRSKVVE